MDEVQKRRGQAFFIHSALKKFKEKKPPVLLFVAAGSLDQETAASDSAGPRDAKREIDLESLVPTKG